LFTRKLLYFVILSFVGALLLYLSINRVEPFESFSLRFNDINFNLQKKEPNKDIVFVAIDEPSVNEFGRWPWKREILAKGIDKLTESQILIMDMIFSEPTNERSDKILSDSIANVNASVCGFFLRQKATQLMGEEELDLLDDSVLDLLQSQIARESNPIFVSAPYAEINILQVLQSCSLSGSFSTLAESDKLLRSYPVSLYFHNKLFPSLSVQALRIKYDKDIIRVSENEVSLNKKTITLNDKGFVRLNFYKRQQYNIVSFLDLVNGKIEPSFFKDKIVLLGITEIGAGDVVSTPVGFLYGPLLHYTFLSNFLEDHLIVEKQLWTSLLIIFFLFLPLLLLLLVKKTLYRSLLNATIYILVYIGVRYLFVEYMLYIDLFYPLLALLISVMLIEMFEFNSHEKKSKFIKDAFSAYLSSSLLEQLVKKPDSLSLGGEKKELTILFSDIRGFTTLSESMSAHDLVHLLNRYFTPMTDAVLEHNGMLDKYIGDAIMAFFNAPVDVKEHAKKACFSALDMIEKLKELNQELLLEGIQPIEIGIGINTAEVVVGNMGSDTRFNYTVMGDGVNLASRVEALTKQYGVNIIITEFTRIQIGSEFLWRELEPVIVKGKDEAILLYELMPLNEKSLKQKELYNTALELYKTRECSQAKKIFLQLSKEYNDSVAKYFIEKIKRGVDSGVQRMQVK